MLANCGNPKCTRRFMRLSEGKLFWQEVASNTAHGQQDALQMVWFCDECAEQMLKPLRPSDSAFSPVLAAEDRPRSLAQIRATHS